MRNFTHGGPDSQTESGLHSEIDADGVDSAGFLGVDKLLLVCVEEVVRVEEDLALLGGLIAYLEVDRASRVDLCRAEESRVAPLADDIRESGNIPLAGGPVDEPHHAID